MIGNEQTQEQLKAEIERNQSLYGEAFYIVKQGEIVEVIDNLRVEHDKPKQEN